MIIHLLRHFVGDAFNSIKTLHVCPLLYCVHIVPSPYPPLLVSHMIDIGSICSSPPLGVTLKADNLIVGRSADKLPGQRLRAVGARVALLMVVLTLQC